MNSALTRFFVGAFVCVALAGCGGGRTENEIYGVKHTLGLIANAYGRARQTIKKIPSNIDEVAQAVKREGCDNFVLDDIKAGKYVIIYGVDFRAVGATGKASETIIAYEARVPTQGGFAVTCDKQFIELTPEQFKTALIATPTPPMPAMP